MATIFGVGGTFSDVPHFVMYGTLRVLGPWRFFRSSIQPGAWKGYSGKVTCRILQVTWPPVQRG
jgi:hypothetical protein